MSDQQTPRTRVAVVGAARGIGREVAVELAKSGARVAAIDLGEDNFELGYQLGRIDTADFGEVSKGVLRIAADARSETEMTRAAAEIKTAFGGLDQLVVAAGGIVGGATLLQSDPASLSLALQFNLLSLHNSVRALVPLIYDSPLLGLRRIVAVASVAGSRPLAGIGAYVAAKHAVVGYLKTLALELAEVDITVNWVSPGSTTTAILVRSAELYGLEGVDDFAIHHPLGRLLAPSEVAAGVIFLLSAAASAITGTDLYIDAGMHL